MRWTVLTGLLLIAIVSFATEGLAHGGGESSENLILSVPLVE